MSNVKPPLQAKSVYIFLLNFKTATNEEVLKLSWFRLFLKYPILTNMS